MLRLLVVVFVLSAIVPAMAKKPSEWCQGTSCITGVKALAGGWEGMNEWHKCRPGELNACRKWSVGKPK